MPAFQEGRRGGTEGRGLEAVHLPGPVWSFLSQACWAVHLCEAGLAWVSSSTSGFTRVCVCVCVCVCAWLHRSVRFFHVNAYMQVRTSVHVGGGLCVPAHLGVHLYFEASVRGRAHVCTRCFQGVPLRVPTCVCSCACSCLCSTQMQECTCASRPPGA